MADPPIAVIGVIGGEVFGRAAADAIVAADVVVGAPRHLEAVAPSAPQRVELAGPLDPILELIDDRSRKGEHVCVLASGDPGFFGIVRSLSARVGRDRLVVHPAPSSTALAFARLGIAWDHARVVSAHGRALDDAIRAALDAPLVAFLPSPDNPPERIAAALLDAGCGARDVSVVARIGEPAESVTRGDLATIAAGRHEHLSVMVVEVPGVERDGPGLTWGRDDAAFEHRAGMITKAEVRAVALGKLALPPTGVLWDVGAGSGSVAIEAAALRPGLRVFAVERQPDDAARIRANAETHGADVTVVEGDAPDALAALPDPDRVFIGGGGLDVLGVVLARLRPGGVVVANYTIVDRAAQAYARLGNLVEVSVSRGTPVADLGVRLAAENPVFVCWGPENA